MKYYIGLIFLMMNLGMAAQLRCVATSNPTGAYAVVTGSGLDYESPECVHGSFGPHITQAFDSLLNRYVFLFHSHINDDNDRCLNFDRVRMEIKGGPNTSPESQHLLNTTSYYRWKFKIPADFKGSSSFCHIFQNKIFGGNDTDFPVITLTPRESVLEIIHNGGDSGLPLGKLATVNLSLLRGRWIEAYIKQFHAEAGKIEIELKDVISKQVILTYKNDTIDLWRAGAEYSRPKWGIYRAKGASLKDEIIQLADFCISESAESLCPSENVVIADNIKPSTPANLIITDKSRFTIDLSWNTSTDNLGVTQYNITRNGQVIKSLNALNYKDTGLLPGTIYTYTITAQDAANNVSSPSNSVVATTDAANVKPGIPLLVSPVDQAQNLPLSTMLKWVASSNADKYKVYLSTANPPNLLYDTLTLAVSPILSANTKYYWQIGATNENGESKTQIQSFSTGSSSADSPWFVYRANDKMHKETNFFELNSNPDKPARDTIINDSNGSPNTFFVYEDDSDQNFRWRYRLTPQDTAVTIVARFKSPSPSINGICFFEVRGFGWREKVRINQSTVKLERASPVIEVDHPFNWNDEFHILRMTMRGKVTSIYLDENPDPIAVGVSGESNTGTYFEWGKSGPGPYAAILDWLVLDKSGAFAPGKGSKLPTDLFLSSDATLSSLQYDGKPVPGFLSYKFDYTIPVADGKLPNLQYTLSSDLASVLVNHPSTVINMSSKIIVSAQDGWTKKTYTIKYEGTNAVSEEDFDQLIKMYPNPTTNLLNIIVDKQIKGSGSITDITGKIIQQFDVQNDISLDFTTFKRGIYILTIHTSNGTVVSKKIIVE